MTVGRVPAGDASGYSLAVKHELWLCLALHMDSSARVAARARAAAGTSPDGAGRG